MHRETKPRKQYKPTTRPHSQRKAHSRQPTSLSRSESNATISQPSRGVSVVSKRNVMKKTSHLTNKASSPLPTRTKRRFSTTTQPNDPSSNLLFHTNDDVFGATRTHYIGDLDSLAEGTNVSISGWIDRIRPMGQLFFVVLRDSTGTVQATLEKHEVEGHEEIFKTINHALANNPTKKTSSATRLYGTNTVGIDTTTKLSDSTSVDMSTVGNTAYDVGMGLGPEYVVSVKGVLQSRPAEMIKKDQKMGSKEIRIRGLRLLNTSKPLPISIHDEFEVTGEDHRMKHRYLDLRRDFNQYVLKLRSQLTMQARIAMYLLGFQEIETPYLVKSTPEGAREFLVPSRSPGKFYALPQSPQQFKQLLMCGGFDKYFQIARCFRDESGRQDRQPEFTQLDLELSFATPDMVMKSVETMVNTMHLQAYGVPMKALKKIRFIDALNRFGSDKPDLRFSSELHDLTHYFTDFVLDGKGQRPLIKKKGAVGDQDLIAEQPTTTQDYIQQASFDTIQDDTVSQLLKIYPPFLHGQHELKTKGEFGHFVTKQTTQADSLQTQPTTSNEEIQLKVTQINPTTGDTVTSFKPLARHPFPVVKMMVARDLNDVLSKGKNKDKMDKILRDCREGSNGLSPTIVSCNKWNKVKPSQVVLSQESIQQQLIQDFDLKANDLLFILTGDWENVCNGLGKIRLNLKNLFKEGCVELLPAVIDGERIQPQKRLEQLDGTNERLNFNPFTRFDDYLINNDWRQQNVSFFQNEGNQYNSSNSLIAKRKALNLIGPLPTFHWVVDFPLFEPHIPSSLYQKQHDLNTTQRTNTASDSSNDAITISAMHHPFTAPHPHDIDEFNRIMGEFAKKVKLDPVTSQPLYSQNDLPTQTINDSITNYPLDLTTVSQQLGQIRALHYDLVSNGLEVGGGSIRLHQSVMQKQVFDILQVPHDKFSHLINALELGAPPHGGFAAGLDRLIAIFGSQHPQGDPLKLKDVIAFLKSSTGNDLLLGTPNQQTGDQLNEYSIMVKNPEGKEHEGKIE